MKFQDILNPKLWEGFNLKPEVADKLEEIANAFIEYLNIDEDAVQDIRITGSSANYNYNDLSDLDLHLIIDYDKLHEDCPLVEGYLWGYKSQFNDNHDISIYGIPVEVYAENMNQPAVSNGTYSLVQGDWIHQPEKIEPTDNDAAVEAKYNELKEMVDNCDDSEEAQNILDKIYDMRKVGLADAGEFSTENLAFKKLRNEGCMDKLRKLKKEKIDKQLSLESYNESIKESYTIQNVESLEKAEEIVKEKLNPKNIRIAKTFGLFYDGNKNIAQYGKGSKQLVILDSKNESIKEAFNKGDKVQLKRKNNKIGIVKSIFNGDKDKNNKDIKYLDVEFEDGTKEGRPASDFRKVNESVNEESQLDKETELAQKLIDMCEQMGFEIFQDRFDWIDLGNGIHIQVWTGSVTVVDYNTGDETELQLETEEDLQNILNQIDELKKNESIKEDYEDDDYEDVPEEMHKERYVTYFETQEGRQKYTIYHVYTDSTDDSYNELCDKRDNQLGMYSSYKELKDALKERAEKIAKQQGWTVKSIDNLGEDDEYYRERNKWESVKKENGKLKVGDIVDIYCTGQTRLSPKWFYNMTVETVYPNSVAFRKENGKRYVVSNQDLVKVKFHTKNESIKEEFFVGNDKYIIVPVSYVDNDIRILDKKTGEFLKDEKGKNLKFDTEEECGNYIKSISESIELPMYNEREPYIEVTLAYGRPLGGYRLIDGILYYTGRNGTKQIGKNVTLTNLAKRILSHAKNITKMDIDKIEVDDKVIWDCVNGFINESILEEDVEDKIYYVEYDYSDDAPGLAIGSLKVKAKSEEEALKKAEKHAAHKHPGYYIEDSCRIVDNTYTNVDLVESMKRLNKKLERIHEDVIPAILDSTIIKYGSELDDESFEKLVTELSKLIKNHRFITYRDLKDELTQWRYTDEMINKLFAEVEKRSGVKNNMVEAVEIETKNPGILEVPEGKNVEDLPQSHFEKLVKKKGYEEIIRALTNLEVWNKNKNKPLSRWASNMADKLKKKFRPEDKNESYLDTNNDNVYKVVVRDVYGSNAIIKNAKDIETAKRIRAELKGKYKSSPVYIVKDGLVVRESLTKSMKLLNKKLDSFFS